jgi:hypothetical protein
MGMVELELVRGIQLKQDDKAIILFITEGGFLVYISSNTTTSQT